MAPCGAKWRIATYHVAYARGRIPSYVSLVLRSISEANRFPFHQDHQLDTDSSDRRSPRSTSSAILDESWFTATRLPLSISRPHWGTLWQAQRVFVCYRQGATAKLCFPSSVCVPESSRFLLRQDTEERFHRRSGSA